MGAGSLREEVAPEQQTPLRKPNAELRTREYLTPHEVEQLIEAAHGNRKVIATPR